MKLLELTRLYAPSVGGMERFVADREKIFESLGIACTVLTTTFTTEKNDGSLHDGRVIRLRQYTPYNIVPRLNAELRDDYDIVSINLLGRYYSDFSIMHYADRRQKILLTPYYTYHTDRWLVVKTIMERMLFPFLLGKVDALVVFTEIEKDFWMCRYGIASEKIFVIPPYLASDERPLPAARRMGDEKYFLYIGRAGANKKTDELLRAFMHLDDPGICLYLTIRPVDVGAEIRSAVVGHSRIRLLGYVDDDAKAGLIAGTEALVFPTSWESFGYVAFEAGAHAKPVLCSDIPVLRELHGGAGALFFHNDPAGIESAMREFLALDDARSAAMGRANRVNFSRFTFAAAREQYRRLFHAIAKNGDE